jgi:hypothetical protein
LGIEQVRDAQAEVQPQPLLAVVQVQPGDLADLAEAVVQRRPVQVQRRRGAGDGPGVVEEAAQRLHQPGAPLVVEQRAQRIRQQGRRERAVRQVQQHRVRAEVVPHPDAAQPGQQPRAPGRRVRLPRGGPRIVQPGGGAADAGHALPGLPVGAQQLVELADHARGLLDRVGGVRAVGEPEQHGPIGVDRGHRAGRAPARRGGDHGAQRELDLGRWIGRSVHPQHGHHGVRGVPRQRPGQLGPARPAPGGVGGEQRAQRLLVGVPSVVAGQPVLVHPGGHAVGGRLDPGQLRRRQRTVRVDHHEQPEQLAPLPQRHT